MLKLIEDKVFSGGIPTEDVKHEVNQEEEEAAKTVANEILSTAGDVDKGCNNSEQQRQAEQVAKEASKLLQTIARDSEDIPDIPAFDDAASSLFEVSVQGQSDQVLTFLKLAKFSLAAVHFYKLCRQSTLSDIDNALILLIIGTQMHRVAIQYGLYTWIQQNGGLRGLCTEIRSYCSQLISDATSAISIPWPKTVTVFGIIIFATSATIVYYKYK